MKHGQHITRTHCLKGHELTSDNVVSNRRGHRKCKTCHRERQKRSHKASNVARRNQTRERADQRARLEPHVRMERDHHYRQSISSPRGSGSAIVQRDRG